MAYVMKVSKSGWNVLTATDENLSFSSELATHSIYAVVDLAKSSGTTTATYSHNLGFVPKTWVFLEDSDGDGSFYRRAPLWYSGERIDYKVTSTQIIIQNEVSASAYDFRIVIFSRAPMP